MTTMNPATAGVEQLMLIVFTLVILVGMAGVKPDVILRPLLDMLTRLVVSLIGLLCTVLAELFKAVFALIPALIKAVGSGASSASARKIR
ncbi:MAG TPA: hypothetical protein V6D22_04525 [Candidatus Obscuribacterales bacterium]